MEAEGQTQRGFSGLLTAEAGKRGSKVEAGEGKGGWDEEWKTHKYINQTKK